VCSIQSGVATMLSVVVGGIVTIFLQLIEAKGGYIRVKQIINQER
jgi:hypothetical protein